MLLVRVSNIGPFGPVRVLGDNAVVCADILHAFGGSGAEAVTCCAFDDVVMLRNGWWVTYNVGRFICDAVRLGFIPKDSYMELRRNLLR
jgi:hypothetical protein